jgi:hypothetical protein
VLDTSWMKDTQARRALAEARPKKPARRGRMTQEEIMNLVTEQGCIMRALKDADPAASPALPADRPDAHLPPTGNTSSSATEFDHVRRSVSRRRFRRLLAAARSSWGFRRPLRRTATVARGTSVCRARGRPLERAPGGPGEQRGEGQFGEARHGQRLGVGQLRGGRHRVEPGVHAQDRCRRRRGRTRRRMLVMMP